jgi:hypothetical protein
VIVNGVMYTTAGATATLSRWTQPPANSCGTGALRATCSGGTTSSIRWRGARAAASATGATARATSGSLSS